MASAKKNLPKIKTSRDYHNLNDSELGDFAYGIKFTGDPDATSPFDTDASVQALAAAMRTTHSGRQISTSKTATSSDTSERDALLRALDENASYLDVIANRVAKAKGDVEAGKGVITRIGFAVAGKGTGKHAEGVVGTGVGWVHVREAKAKKGEEGHIWEGGPTSSKGVPPPTTQHWYTLEVECIFNNIPSGTVFGYRHASVVPVKHKSKPAVKPAISSATSKSATLPLLTKGNHPVIDFKNTSPYVYGEWRYVVTP